MTTIAYRNGWIAADTGLSDNSTRDMFMTKIAKNSKGHLAGASGAATWLHAFLTWFKDGRVGEIPISNGRNGCAIIVEKRNAVICVESIDGKIGTFPISGPYQTLGSGSDFALGAMFAGATASAAVRAAMRHDNGTFGRVQTLRFGK